MLAVLDNGPYAIDGALFMLMRWQPGLVFANMTPTYVLLWVRIRGIPSECFNQETGWKLASLAGDPTEVRTGFLDARNLSYLRARVWIKLKSPLVPGFFLRLPHGGTTWVSFEYERVHKICRKCGIIGHTIPYCRFLNEDEALDDFLRNHFQDLSHEFGLPLRWDVTKELYPKTIRAHAHCSHLRTTSIPTSFWNSISSQFYLQNSHRFEDGFKFVHSWTSTSAVDPFIFTDSQGSENLDPEYQNHDGNGDAQFEDQEEGQLEEDFLQNEDMMDDEEIVPEDAENVPVQPPMQVIQSALGEIEEQQFITVAGQILAVVPVDVGNIPAWLNLPFITNATVVLDGDGCSDTVSAKNSSASDFFDFNLLLGLQESSEGRVQLEVLSESIETQRNQLVSSPPSRLKSNYMRRWFMDLYLHLYVPSTLVFSDYTSLGLPYTPNQNGPNVRLALVEGQSST